MLADSDPLIAIGPNNRTYWIMLFVRTEAIVHYKYVYFAAVFLEVTLTIAGYYLHYRGSMLVWKCKILHINFLIINGNSYAVMLMGSLARLVIILYETKIIEFPGLGFGPVPTLAIIRQISFGSSSIIGYAVVTGIVNGILVSALALIPNILCAVMIIHNKAKHSRLTNKIKRDPNDEYSLSLRVQLNENIWSMQKMEFGVYAITAALSLNLLFVFLPMFVLPLNQFELLQWFTCAGNVGFAFTITATAPILEVIVAIHKGNIPPFLIRLFGKECFGATTSIKEKRNEAEIYFTHLAHQWNM